MEDKEPGLSLEGLCKQQTTLERLMEHLEREISLLSD
jgi:hypothetical protein